MQSDIPTLFVEINLSNIIFAFGTYDENQNFKVIDKIIVPNKDINKNKFTNIIQAQEIIKKNIEIIEKKSNYIFKEVIVILDNFEFLFLNILDFSKNRFCKILYFSNFVFFRILDILKFWILLNFGFF